MHLFRLVKDIVHDPVDAEADHRFLLVGLHVNIRRLLLNRAEDHRVHEADHGGFVLGGVGA